MTNLFSATVLVICLGLTGCSTSQLRESPSHTETRVDTGVQPLTGSPEPTGDSSPRDPYVAFIANMEWPEEVAIRERRVPVENVPEDVGNFKVILKTVIQQAYLVPDDVIDSQLIAVRALRDENDYLLLRYYARNGYLVQVEEGKALWILITPEAGSSKGESIGTYVGSVAFSVLNIPRDGATVLVSQAKIRNGWLGTLLYKDSFPPPKYWYSYIRWWSDGKSVVFSISRLLCLEKADLTGQASLAPKSFAPRKFEESQQ